MTTSRILTAHVAAMFLALTAAGLLARGRASFCWSFFAYVCATMTSDLATAAWPERFFVYTVYSMKETVLTILKVLVGLEISLRTFSEFPRARVRVGLLLAGGLVAMAAMAFWIPPREGVYEALIIQGSRLQSGTLLLYALIATAAARYRLPLHPLHRAIVLGFAAYLTLHSIVLSIVASDTDNIVFYEVSRWINSLTYCAVCAWWARAAWRPVRDPSPLISRLQPWARSW